MALHGNNNQSQAKGRFDAFAGTFKLCVALFLFLYFMLRSVAICAQQPVVVDDQVSQHIFSFREISCLEDSSGKLTFREILSRPVAAQFRPSQKSTPQNYKQSSVYWYKISVQYPPYTRQRWILEFFDQTIDDIRAYMPAANGSFKTENIGALHKFSERQYYHKNFEINLEPKPGNVCTYYFRIKSHETADIIIVLRTVKWFIRYALYEYLLFGVFYGMIFVFALYSLLMFLAIRQRQHLYYVLYILSVGFYELCSDGIGYQYLWPDAAGWNEYAYAFALCSVSVFALMFAGKLLFLKGQSPVLYKIINVAICGRILLFFICLFTNKQWFNYRYLEFIPFCIAFYCGIHVFVKGFRPARFFVLGYSFLFMGFVIKLLINMGYGLGTIGYYGLSISFIFEMLCFAFALSDNVRLLKKESDRAQRETIKQLRENERLRESINQRLEEQVRERTGEVLEKAKIIEQQNEELNQANDLLQQQAENILRMNLLLEQDKRELQTGFEKVSRDRIMSAGVDFEEFSRIYPDADSCYRFLAELKWSKGYRCHKCAGTHSFSGHVPHSRRCSKCSYEESVTAYTLFHNSRIPITKAFYIIFLIYSSNGKISSHKLSEIVEIRQSTCWAYSNRIKKLMSARKKGLRNDSHEGWSRMVLDMPAK